MMSVLSYLSFRHRRRAERLYEQGRDKINRHLYDHALAIARKLRKVRYSGAFEIEGLAYYGLGRLDDAIRVLREGLERWPDDWMNWSLLGSCLSEAGRYAEALEAYGRADECDPVDHALVNLNRAVVALRQHDFHRVLELLDGVETHPFQTAALRATALGALGRHHESEHLAMRTLEAWRQSDQLQAKRDAGELALIVLGRRYERGEDPAALRDFAIQWWRDSHHEGLLAFIRELRPERSPDARYFRIRFIARFPFADEEVEGIHNVAYWMSADAVADTSDEALALIFELSPPPAGANVEIEKISEKEPRPNGTKGVYYTTARVFFKDEPVASS